MCPYNVSTASRNVHSLLLNVYICFYVRMRVSGPGSARYDLSNLKEEVYKYMYRVTAHLCLCPDKELEC